MDRNGQDERAHKCSECGQTFSVAKHLIRHTKAVHEGIGSACPICGRLSRPDLHLQHLSSCSRKACRGKNGISHKPRITIPPSNAYNFASSASINRPIKESHRDLLPGPACLRMRHTKPTTFETRHLQLLLLLKKTCASSGSKATLKAFTALANMRVALDKHTGYA
jgi:uncharacterized Zn-finger protein